MNFASQFICNPRGVFIGDPFTLKIEIEKTKYAAHAPQGNLLDFTVAEIDFYVCCIATASSNTFSVHSATYFDTHYSLLAYFREKKKMFKLFPK